VANREGVSDVFLWGASFQRVAHPVEPGLLFVSAGTVTADPGAVTGSTRWATVMDGFQRAGATLALFAPHDADGIERLVARASDVIVLATRDEAASLALPGEGERIRAVLGPPPEEPVAPSTGAMFSAIGGFGRPEEPPEWEAELSEAVAVHESRGRRSWLWLTLGLLIAIAVVAAAWAGWVDVPYLSPMLAGRAETVQTSEGVSAVPAAGPEEAPEASASPGDTRPGVAPSPDPEPGQPMAQGARVMTFSLAMAAYPDRAAATSEMETLRTRRPDVLFFLAPVEVDGRVFHRLLAGTAGTMAALEDIRTSLGTSFGASNAERWILRDAGEAYLLGAHPTEVEAEAHVAELRRVGIDAYVLEVPDEESGPYRVYAGGYADLTESMPLGVLLEEAGLSDAELVDRVGHIPR